MNRTTIEKQLVRTATAIREKKRQVETLRWTLAKQAYAFRGTFPAGGEKAAIAQAATATGFAESDIGNLIRAYEVLSDLTPAQAEKVQALSWTTDAALTLRGKNMTPARRTSLLNWSEKQGTRNVKKLREQKAKLVGGTTRNRRNKQDEQIALAKSLGATFEKKAKSFDVLAMIAGAQLAQENPGKDVAAALTFWNAQREAAAKKVAA